MPNKTADRFVVEFANACVHPQKVPAKAGDGTLCLGCAALAAEAYAKEIVSRKLLPVKNEPRTWDATMGGRKEPAERLIHFVRNGVAACGAFPMSAIMVTSNPEEVTCRRCPLPEDSHPLEWALR